jgi:hypothetical protein
VLEQRGSLPDLQSAPAVADDTVLVRVRSPRAGKYVDTEYVIVAAVPTSRAPLHTSVLFE